MKKKERKRKRTIAKEQAGSFGRGKQLIWSLRTLSGMACAMVIGYITFYGTNMLGIPASTMGLLIMVSKLFDAVSDIIGGILVDHTHTRLGKGRPYELSMIGIWVCTVIMYACPDFGLTGKCVWLFFWYTLLNDVFYTMLNTAEQVYMMRAIPNREDMEKTASINGIFTIIGAMIVSLVYPVLMAALGSTKRGWTVMAAIFAVPMLIIGMLRFFFIPEVKDVEAQKKEKITAAQMKQGLTSNRYIYLYLLLILFTNLISGISNTNTYYFTYIVKNQAMMSVASLPGMVLPVLLLAFPKLLQKHTVVSVSKVCLVIGIAGNIIKAFAGADMVLILIGSFVSGIGTLPLSAFLVILLTDTVDYNEYKTGTHIEGLYASLGSFGQKIGIALSSALTGFLLQAAGFLSDNTAVQPDSALSMTRAMFGIMPAVVMLLALIVLLFFDLEKKMPEVRAALDARHSASR